MKLDRSCIGVFGRTGFGKSSCVKIILRGFNRILIHDHSCDYEAPGDVECVATSRAEVLTYLWGLKEDEPFSVAYRNDPASDSDPDAVEFLAKLAIEMKRCVLALDEARDSCRADIINSRLLAGDEPAVYHIAGEGRHDEVSLIVSSTRPVDVFPAIRGECYSDQVFLFRIRRKEELRDLANEAGDDVAQRVSRLKRLECLHMADNDEGVTVVTEKRIVYVGETPRWAHG